MKISLPLPLTSPPGLLKTKIPVTIRPEPEGVFNEKFLLSPSHQPPWAFESKNLKAKKFKIEGSRIRFSLSN
jgi:hypothetical protein